jgi:hypothetical protein
VIEDIAVNQLGMTKKENVTKEYISLGEEDNVVLEKNIEEEKQNGSLLSAFSDRFEKFAEYFE